MEIEWNSLKTSIANIQIAFMSDVNTWNGTRMFLCRPIDNGNSLLGRADLALWAERYRGRKAKVWEFVLLLEIRSTNENIWIYCKWVNKKCHFSAPCVFIAKNHLETSFLFHYIGLKVASEIWMRYTATKVEYFLWMALQRWLGVGQVEIRNPIRSIHVIHSLHFCSNESSLYWISKWKKQQMVVLQHSRAK